MAILGSFRGLRARFAARILAIHAASLFVVINWGTFVWASIHRHVVETGLGYLIAPSLPSSRVPWRRVAGWTGYAQVRRL